MSRYIIVEDEQLAYEEMRRMMRKLRPAFEFAGWAASVEQAVCLIQKGNIDLLIIDIRLSDGVSFEIFEQCSVEIPVIFTTAYDKYALDAFRVNSIDYLLKPIGERELDTALNKFERRCCLRSITPEYCRLETDYLSGCKKNRFLVQTGDTFRPVETANVAFFYSEDKYTYLHLFSGSRYIINYTLDRLERMVDPGQFFRVSRNCIANIHSIRKISKYFAGRLSVQFQPECPHEIIVSRNRAEEFLLWVDDAKYPLK